MKNKILLVTLWGNDNYGNKLQTIALQHMVESLGFDVDCATYYIDKPVIMLKRNIKAFLGFCGIKKYRKIYFSLYRQKAIKKSSRYLIHHTLPVIYGFNVENKMNSENYVMAITGSDQVWHKWSDYSNELSYFYLEFMPPEKRMSYAASFGFEEFPINDLEAHFTGLNGMHNISCREKSGCELIKQLTGKDSKLVLDPTLCVKKEFWEKQIIKPEFKISGHYLLVFLLGEKEKYDIAICSFAEQKHLEIIDLLDISRRDVWELSIENFIWMVANADYICTDSFHCLTFCIIFEKKFTVFRRIEKNYEHMYDRISTLLSNLELQEHQFNGKEIFDYICITICERRFAFGTPGWMLAAK